MIISIWALAAAAALSAAIVLILGPFVIPYLRRLKFGQSIRSDGPRGHLKKAGTPTMGGAMFMLSSALTSLGLSAASWWTGWRIPPDADLILALVMTTGYGLIGLADDYVKVALKRSLGLRAREKLLAQVLLALVLALVATRYLNLGTWIRVPYLGWIFDLGLAYPAFVVLVALAAANATNITDGLDGLLAGSAAMAYFAYTLVALAAARYELAVFAMAMVGGCLGFLAYNAHPARVFMGDAGSMALGGGLAALAVLTKTELLLPVIGGLFVLETLSVIIQVTSFQLTGRRVFRMSPLHHHFELLGWPEARVIKTFWAWAAVFSILGILGLGGLGR